MGSFVTGLFQKIQEQTKVLVFIFVFVFVLVDEQAISSRTPERVIKRTEEYRDSDQNW